MRYTPFPEDDRRGSPTQRLLTVVAAVVLIVLAVILLAGPSNVLVLLNLKDWKPSRLWITCRIYAPA